ncbi:hypothetical protein BLA28_11685 [Eisenbergiella tayi]|nr:hypothetical protein BLA28_11685 [Eisenbergiella tayi]
MRQPHLPYLPPPGSSECPEQSGSAAAIVSPVGDMRSTDRVRDSRRGTKGPGGRTGHRPRRREGSTACPIRKG